MSGRRVVLTNSWHYERACLYLDKAYHSDHLWEVYFTRSNKNGNNQKRRYFGLLRQLQWFTGHAVDELHDLMKEKFLGSYTFSITTLPPEEMNAYIAAVEGWAVGWLGMEIDTSFEA